LLGTPVFCCCRMKTKRSAPTSCPPMPTSSNPSPSVLEALSTAATSSCCQAGHANFRHLPCRRKLRPVIYSAPCCARPAASWAAPRAAYVPAMRPPVHGDALSHPLQPRCPAVTAVGILQQPASVFFVAAIRCTVMRCHMRCSFAVSPCPLSAFCSSRPVLSSSPPSGAL
jgi:hypothetical protein